MSKLPLSELVSHLKGKSITSEWDAIAVYDQRKANELLSQLWIERFNTADGYIKPASMVAPWGDGTYKEHIYGLQLSAPVLSFENADPELAARTRLTMNMIGGMIASTREMPGGAAYVSKMLKLLPVGSPQLWMDQPLTKGFVSGIGEVHIDIAKADNFKSNFILGSITQEQVGLRFKDYFEKQVTPEQKRFPLGTLDGYDSAQLTPEHFEIRTAKAKPNAVLGDLEYGDGMVMLLITLRGGTDGKGLPGNSVYLLPADGGGAKYTGALYLSNRVLFDRIIRAPAMVDIGHDISFIDYNGNSDLAWALQARGGGLSKNYEFDFKVRTGDFDSTLYTTIAANFDGVGGSPLTLRAAGPNSLELSWKKTTLHRWDHVIHWAEGDKWYDGNFTFEHDCKLNFNIVLDKETGVVSFIYDPASAKVTLELTHDNGNDFEQFISRLLVPKMKADFRDVIHQALKVIASPRIETFLLRNLLFPSHNALHLSDAFIPGDLAVYGEIDPLRTSTVLSPPNSTIEAGQKLQFTLTPVIEDAIWSVRDVDGNILKPGSISAKGEYTAPPAEVLSNGFVTVIVTASGTLNGLPVQSSALVSVMHSAIVCNPIYESCSPAKTLTLSAEAMSSEALVWEIMTKEWGSSLSVVEGKPNERLYTAGGSGTYTIPFSVDKIKVSKTTNGITTSAYIHILIINEGINKPLLISDESDPATGKVQFQLRGREDKPIDPSLVTWKLMHGEGVFNDKTGEYVEPESPAPGSFIIVSAVIPGVVTDTLAAAAVPLPLSSYRDLIETLNFTLAGH